MWADEHQQLAYQAEFAAPRVKGARATVVLHGSLAEKYGRRHLLGVQTAPEAAHALCALIPGFREDFQDGRFQVVRGRIKDGITLSQGMLGLKVGDCGEIHFIPKAQGSKSGSGTAKTIIGAVILVAAVAASAGALAPVAGGVAAGAAGGATVAAAGLSGTAVIAGLNLGITWGSIAFFGATLLLSGISSLLSSTSNKTVDAKTSYGLSGSTNSTVEGSVLPVVYGRTRVGSVVGSFGYTAEDYNTVTATTAQAAATSGFSGTTSSTATNLSANSVPVTWGGGSVGVGSGSSKGSSSSGATEADNTLRSKAVVRIIDILSEGPIGGLVNGPKSIFFNSTPLMASDGSYNFQGVSWEVRLGYPDQTPVSGYSAAEQTSTVNIQVKNLGAGPIIRTYTSSTATAARITMRIPALYHQNSKNGNLETYSSLSYKIEVRVAGTSSWTQAAADTFVNQKCTSAYQKSYRIDLPNAGTATSWDIRVTRITADPTTSNDQCDTYWDTTTLITEQALAYPNVAYIALTIDAASFGTSIPTRAYEIDGILCQVPANYDPVAGTYASTGTGTALGTWDGATWKLATTSNPCWCVYDMFSNARYGMGLPSSALTYTRYDLYPISQYCDGTVPSGYNDISGTAISERRYEINVQLNSQADAYRAIQSFTSAFRGMSYWGAGRVVITADMPCVPSTVTSQANVIDGEFTYEGSALKTRHTVARVSWLDPLNSYQEAIEVVEDFDAVVTQGQITTDVVAFGCTSRGLARRWGKWLLDTERHQTELGSWGVGLEHLRVRPGDVTRVSDPSYAGVRMGGRCLPGSSTTTVIIDDPHIIYDGGLSWFISVTLPDGTVADRVAVSNIDKPGGISQVHLAQALNLAPDTDSTWVLSTTGSGPTAGGVYPVDTRQFRILALAEPQRGQYQVSGVFHDPNKYARVELGIQFDPTPYSTLNQLLVAPVPPPTNVYAMDYTAGVGTTVLVRTTVGWTSATDPRVIGTQVRAQGPEVRDFDPTAKSTLDIDGLQLGTYVFRARSVGRDGRTSIWVDSPSVLVDGIGDAPDTPTGLTAQGSAMSVQLNWNQVSARDILHYEVWRAPAAANGTHPFPYSGFNPTGSPTSNSATMLATVDGTSYLDQGDVLGPDKAWAYWVRAISTTQQQGGFAGPVKALTTYYLTNNLEEGIRNTAVYAQQLLGGAPTLLTDRSTPGTTDGQLGFDKSTQQLVKWNASGSTWTNYIPLVPSNNGQLSDSQLASIAAAKIVGAFTTAQAASVVAAIGTAAISDTLIAAVSASKVSGSLTNATITAGRVYDVDPVSGSTVVGVAATKLLGQMNASALPTTIAASKLTDTDPSSGLTVAGLAAAKVLGQFSAGQIAAGSIDTTKLAVSSPTNFLSNSCWAYSATSGWGSYSSAGTSTLTPIIGSAAAANWAPGEADGGLWVTGTALPQNGYLDVYSAPKGLNGRPSAAAYPVVVGSTYEAQVRFICGNAASSVQISIDWVNSSNGFISSTSSAVFTPATPANGLLLANWSLAVARGPAPAGAVYASVRIRVTNTTVTTTIPTAYFTQALFGLTVPNSGLAATNPTLTWIPGGVTSVDGATIQTGTLYARAIAANQIGANQLAVGNSTNGVENSCFALTSEGWSLGFTSASGTLNSCAAVNTTYQTSDGVGCILATTVSAGGVIDAYSAPVACAPGDTLEGQALLLPIGISAQVYVRWLDNAGGLVSTSALSAAVAPQATPAAAQQGTLQPFLQAGVVVLTPSTTTIASAQLVVRAINSTGATVTNATVFATRTLLGKTFAGATQLSPWSPGGITQIGGGLIKSNSILASHLTAGSVTANSLAIAGAGNVIGNPTCPISSWGWVKSVLGASLGSTSLGSVTGDGLASASYALSGEGSGVVCAPTGSMSGTDFIQAYWDPDSTLGVACSPGEWWEVQAYLAPNRCYGYVAISFYTAAGAFISSIAGGRVATPATGGTQLASYGLSWTKMQAPASAARVLMSVIGQNDGGGDIQATAGSNPYLFFTRCVLARSTNVTIAQGATPQPYTIGGATQIYGAAMKTGTITARVIGAGQVLASHLAVADSAGNVISNSCCQVGASGWAGGVTAWPATSIWALQGFGTGYLYLPSLASGSISDISWAPNGATYSPDGNSNTVPWGAATPCAPGDLWEAQALVMTHRCSATIYLVFLAQATDGTWQTASSPQSGTQSWAAGANGKIEANYHRISARGTAPAAGTYGGKSCPNGATLVTLLLRMGNDASSQAVYGTSGTGSGYTPYLMFTQAGLANYPGTSFPATQPLPWSPGGTTFIDGGNVKTASIIAGSLAAGAVIAGNVQASSIGTNELAAGSVTAAKMAIGDPSNVIWNSCADQGLDGWSAYPYGSTTTNNITSIAGTGYSPTWYLAGFGSAVAQEASGAAINSSSGAAFDWSPTTGLKGVPITAGHRYGGAALLQSGNGASAFVALLFYDSNGNQVGSTTASTSVTTSAGGGGIESQYTRATVYADAPTNASSLIFRIQMVGGGAAYPFVFWSKAQVGEITAGLTVVGPWVPGGITTISGSVIKTGTLNANRIIAGSITASQIAAGTITAVLIAAGAITATQLAANSVTSDQLAANSVIAGKVQAGAIGATEIAAGQIRTSHLASDFALISSAQIGTLTVDTAQIKNLAVGNGQIGSGAVTSVTTSVINTGAATPGDGSYTSVLEISFSVTDNLNSGALFGATIISDTGASYNVTIANGPDGGNYVYENTTLGNRFIVRLSVTPPGGSRTTLRDLVPDTGGAVAQLNYTRIVPPLLQGTYYMTIYAAAYGAYGYAVRTCVLSALLFKR